MKSLMNGLLPALFLFSSAATAERPAPLVIQPDQIQWTLNEKSGVSSANLIGNRQAEGRFVQRLAFPASFRAPMHTHDGALSATVLSGELRLKFGANGKDVVLPAGSFVLIPPGVPHEEFATVNTELDVHGIGPIQTIAYPGPQSVEKAR